MTTVSNTTQKPQTLSQSAFNAGWGAFFRGGPEFYLLKGHSEIWCKEYTRGWWLAYEKKRSRER